MEILTAKETKFFEILKVFHPRHDLEPEIDELILYYKYNLDYTGKKEEEHKLQAWEKCLNKTFEVNTLFMTIDDLVVNLSYKVEDEPAVGSIVKYLKKAKILVSSTTVLEGIGPNFQKSHSMFSKFMKKVFTSFGLGTNIGELSKGLYWSYPLLEKRAQELHTEVIQTQMISERKIRDFLKIKYRYSEIEQELLLIHMKNNKMIEICQVTIIDETTKEEIDHRAAFSIENVDQNEQKNLKCFELEVNLYALSDAIEVIEDIKEKIKTKVTQNVEEGKEEILKDLLKNVVYAEEVWVNVARSITMIEEQLQVFREVSEVTIQLLIRQSRRDIFFFEKWKNFLLKCLEDKKEAESDSEEDEDQARATQTIQKLSLPQWIRKVEINEEEIQKDINLLLAERWAQDSEDLLKEFMKKVKFDIKSRETFNLTSRSPQHTEMTWTIPNSYMDTITKYQEFFGFDENFEPTNNTTNPFEVEFRVSRVRNDLDDEEASPEVRKSVVVQFDSYADGDYDSQEDTS